MRHIAARVLLVLAGILAGFLVSEGLFRLLGLGNPASSDDFIFRWTPSSPFRVHEDPEIQVALKPSFQGAMVYERALDHEVFKRVPLHISRLGLRGPDRPQTPPRGTTRILALGDSFTFGQGVGDTETYPAVLERLLASRGAYDVLNAGVPTWNLQQEVRWLELNGERLEPTIITLGFFVNDLEPMHYRDPRDPMPPAVARVPAWASWERGPRRYSFVYNYVARKMERRRLARALMGVQKDYRAVLRASMETDAFTSRLEDGFDRLRNQCEALRSRCIVLLIPMLDAFHVDPLADFLARIGREARRFGFEVLDLTPALTPIPQAQLTVLPGEAHPSALAQHAMGEAIAEYLQQCPTPCPR